MSASLQATPTFQRALLRLTRALLERDVALAERAEAAIAQAMARLAAFPMLGPPAREQRDVTLRELVIPFGRDGFVVLYRLASPGVVRLLAIRAQREPWA